MIDVYTPKKLFYLFFICLLIRFVFAVWLPFTGDEAYFAIWGMKPDLGYYDHTPLLGWLLYPLLKFGNIGWLLRLPSIILPVLIAAGIYQILKKFDVRKAIVASLLFLTIPLSLFFPLISTDVPLIFFSFYSTYFLYRAIEKNNKLFYFLLSGICLGLAFLSKYFAVLLGLAFFIYFLTHYASKKRLLGFLILFTAVLPFGLINIYWNYHHAWANILFNVFNRNHDAGFNGYDPLIYLLFLCYSLTPVILYFFLRNSRKLLADKPAPAFSLFYYSAFIPLAFFFVLSFFKMIGLHWVFSFIPLIFVIAGYVFSDSQLIKALKFNYYFSGLHLILLILVLSLPLNVWQKISIDGENYTDLVYFFHHKSVRENLSSYNQNYIFASHSYATADMMHFDSGIDAIMFGVGSVHGRQGDLITDFKQYAGKNFLILDSSYPDIKLYAPYFKQMQVKSFDYKGARFYYILAEKFDYEKYRELVLNYIYHTYWQVPKYLSISDNFYARKYSFPVE